MIFIKKQGNQTYILANPVNILETAAIVGPKEKEGPLHSYFDKCLEDEFWGESSWEKAETKILRETINTCVSKSKIPSSDIDFCFAGDLLNQCISSSFGVRDSNIPFFGVFRCLFNIRRKFNFRFNGYRWRFCRKYIMCCFKSFL